MYVIFNFTTKKTSSEKVKKDSRYFECLVMF